MRQTSFISTTPLDILAFGMMTLMAFAAVIAIVTLFSLISSAYDINVNIDSHGYDLLITKDTISRKGFGFMLKDGLQVWKYNEVRNGDRKETLVFPFPIS